jgi:RNase P subunit RPR2
MTANLQTHQQTTRLDFLFEAGYTMFTSCPSLSRYYMNEFQNTLTEYELTAAKPTARLSCSSCGQINVPGLTSQVDIYKKKKNKRNLVRAICLSCRHTSLYHGSYKQKLAKQSCVTSKAPVIPVATPTIKPSDGPMSKKKKNKGKKNNLKALLNKQPSSNSSIGGGGGLGDFLSSL